MSTVLTRILGSKFFSLTLGTDYGSSSLCRSRSHANINGKKQGETGRPFALLRLEVNRHWIQLKLKEHGPCILLASTLAGEIEGQTLAQL